ncbi:PVC-type heme-binding CxxCH protein [Haloferula sp. BvORR071]|uniref:PVC-type heme-binding CxxCH protein n=1 Tax=Haloferula sp. BvORR071 TaxID=1396141 RepID=UPI000698FE76|nr:PVC-type heme-binding CxxCH protein [Haloferula sp. BvORR071]
MSRLSSLFLGLAPLAALHATADAAAPAFEFKDGDVVAFLGDGFAEREQYEGTMEAAIIARLPQLNLHFRNLGWSGDTPAGASRCGLSLGQAGTEPPEEGWKQLQKQLATYKPSVLITGYGMASSLPGSQTPEEFRRDLERLLDHAAAIPGLRVVVLGAPPRFPRPGETNETPLLRQHRESLAAINSVQQELATKRGLPFVSLDSLDTHGGKPVAGSDGIHLGAEDYAAIGNLIANLCGVYTGDIGGPVLNGPLIDAIKRKNEWFFHRSRPANMAYIFGFRKAEQGRNAGEIEAFDKLVAGEETRITAILKKEPVPAEPPVRTESQVAAHTPQPHPEFTVADGYEVTLWAENPMMHKPTQMNFDSAGRLWVASSETYPQVEVGQTADDKIVVLDDTDGDGKADSSKVFTTGLLMPTAVLPVTGGCYVAQSTDLLYFPDKNGDLTADSKQRVLSGFGTEDTHHNLHTLRRGPDGKLWMNQSIYTRSDVETPNGVMRLRSGGIMRFDPVADKIKPVFYGWCNPWGHQFDQWGQSFVTDGAGGQGINWAVPGAMYFTYAGADKVLDSISPGSYPKFCGLEIIESPLFPAEWQGSMITCDFRAHRVVRFNVTESGSGYAAQEAGDLLRTESVNFRPIDVKIGPDGALYIADWSNPIINHGEVDFRDPRRDREHGRIWRVQKKGSAPAPRQDLAKLDQAKLLEKLTSDQRYEREEAMAVLVEREKSPRLDQEISSWEKEAKDGRKLLAALWLNQGLAKPDAALLEKALADPDGKVRAAALRSAGDSADLLGKDKVLALAGPLAGDEHPRVRLEAVRVLAGLGVPAATDAALQAVAKPRDRFLDYALWLTVRDQGQSWLNAVLDGKLPLDGRDTAFEFVLGNLPKGGGMEGIRKLMPQRLSRDGSGPWIGLALKTGDPQLLKAVYLQSLDPSGFEPLVTAKALDGLAAAVSAGKLKPDAGNTALAAYFSSPQPELACAALRFAGALEAEPLLGFMKEAAADAKRPLPVRLAAVDGMSRFTSAAGKDALQAVAAGDLQAPVALALSRNHRVESLQAIRPVLAGLGDLTHARAFWQQALAVSGLSADLAKSFREQALPAAVAAANLPAVADIDENAELIKVLRAQAGVAAQGMPGTESVAKLAKLAAEQGDAARGEMIYRRAEMACSACHSIGGAGGKVGPDMTSIGASAPMDYLVESVLTPGAKVKEGYHGVVFETKDGRTIMGRLLRSGGGSVVISDAAGQELTLSEDAILKKTDTGSLMPAGLINSLKEQEQADLFKFLSQLGRPGDFDATKSRAPRTWAVLPSAGTDAAAAMAGEPALPWVTVNGTVNGTLLASDLATAVPAGGEIFAATKLQLAQPAELTLNFPDSGPACKVTVDGKEVSGGQILLQGGLHKIVVRCNPGGKSLRFEASDGTFLPVW